MPKHIRQHTTRQVITALIEEPSIAAAARRLGHPYKALRRRMNREGIQRWRLPSGLVAIVHGRAHAR